MEDNIEALLVIDKSRVGGNKAVYSFSALTEEAGKDDANLFSLALSVGNSVTMTSVATIKMTSVATIKMTSVTTISLPVSRSVSAGSDCAHA